MEWDTASLFPWHTGHRPLWEALPGTPEHSRSPSFLSNWILLQMQTHWCLTKGKDHFHRHAGSTTASTAQGAGAALPQGPLLAYVKLGSLDLSCGAVSQQLSPTLCCIVPFQSKMIHPLPTQSIFQCNTFSFSFSL